MVQPSHNHFILIINTFVCLCYIHVFFYKALIVPIILCAQCPTESSCPGLSLLAVSKLICTTVPLLFVLVFYKLIAKTVVTFHFNRVKGYVLQSFWKGITPICVNLYCNSRCTYLIHSTYLPILFSLFSFGGVSTILNNTACSEKKNCVMLNCNISAILVTIPAIFFLCAMSFHLPKYKLLYVELLLSKLLESGK